MDAGLHKASLMGDVLYLKENAHILDTAADVAETPLHIAALFGHVEFAKEILTRKPELARVLDPDGSSPLHLASAKGHIEIVKELLKIDTDICLVRDKDGRTPLHVAVLKGRLEVVKEVVGANRAATRVLMGGRESILHLCVNRDQFEIVKALLEYVEKDDEFVKMKDENDNTILHLAVQKKHIPLTKFLLHKTKMREEVNALNLQGFTALDVLLKSSSKSEDMKLQGLLRGAEAKRAKAMNRNNDDWIIQPVSPRKNRWEKHIDWLNETRSALMVVAVLIASVTFQAEMNPPGGVWQDDKTDAIEGSKNHTAGKSVMADKYPDRYIAFSISNGIAFIASLSIILLVISGFHFKRRIFIWTLMIITWMAVYSMIFTFVIALCTLCNDETMAGSSIVYTLVIFTWLVLSVLLFVAQLVRFIKWLARKVTTLIYTCTYRNRQPSNGSDRC